MTIKYTCKKQKYSKNGLSYMYVVFDNGELFTIKNPEINNLKIETYDKLVWHENGVCPVASGGYIKLKICNKKTYYATQNVVCYPEKYMSDRKAYIEERCLTDRIVKIMLFNALNCHKVIFVNAKAKKENDFLILEFLPVNNMGSFESDTHFVEFLPISKENIRKINLDFENCESITVYDNEILDIDLKFSNNIWCGTGDFCRNIIGGHITIKLDKDFDREYSLFEHKKAKLSDFEKRLCGKGFDYHDICHLYINYYHIGFGYNFEECIEIDDVRYPQNEEIENNQNESDDDEEYDDNYYYFVGGYCEKQKDGSIIIVFGEDSKSKLMNSKKFADMFDN